VRACVRDSFTARAFASCGIEPTQLTANARIQARNSLAHVPVEGLNLPFPEINPLPLRNGMPAFHLSNKIQNARETAVRVAAIPLWQWPALLGRPVFFTVEAKILSPLTGVSLGIDTGDGQGFQFDARMLACESLC
jgi:hypothetical protein